MAKPKIKEYKEKLINLDDLLLDNTNPRFGSFLSNKENQSEVLDWIVKKFNVDDVLSSLAVNGYFAAEPMLCKPLKGSDKYIVVEGNRRLAACLILTGDSRAKNHAKRTAHYSQIHSKYGSKRIDPVNAIDIGSDSDKQILSYLGVRHIAASQPWDSYAKAAWVAKAVETNDASVDDIALMIGDTNKTVAKLLEGYYFIQQLIKAGYFVPENSVRSGRGSVTEYPFSWVYTILGFENTRKFLGLKKLITKKNPIAKDKLDDAALLITAMFGDKSEAKNGAITDSRQISQLAKVLDDRENITLLKQGKNINEIIISTQPLDIRMSEGLLLIKQTLSDLMARFSGVEVSSEEAEKYMPKTGENKTLANKLHKIVNEAAYGSDGE